MISLFKKKPKIYRHGDLLIRQVKKIPCAIRLDTNIIAEGEVTGHNHKLYGSHQVYGTNPKNPRVIEPTYFQAKEDISLKHEEHATLKIKKGNYVIIHEREYNPFKNIQEEVID